MDTAGGGKNAGHRKLARLARDVIAKESFSALYSSIGFVSA